MKEKVVSANYSLEGWSFKSWLTGNWKTVKEILKIAVPLGVSWATVNSPATVGLLTIGGKFVLDLGEYYFKRYTA